jgi:hypothetical protein
MSAEKNRVGPGVADAPKKLGRLVVKHEIEALILSGIRGSVAKRRTQETRGLGDIGAWGTPITWKVIKTKGLQKWGPHKWRERTRMTVQPDRAVEDSARLLCNIDHPKFIVDLRKALEAAGIPYNNANLTSGGIIPGVYYTPNYTVVVLEQDFECATQVMSRVLQHWEFEPSAGFRIGRDSFLDYGLERAAQKG